MTSTKRFDILDHLTKLSENANPRAKYTHPSASDQTGINKVVWPSELSSHVESNIPPKEGFSDYKFSADPNWQKFWPKHSTTSEKFFLYNAKPLASENKIDEKCIPEQIVTESRKENKVGINSDPFTLYLRKEKEKNKLRPKVCCFLYLDYIGKSLEMFLSFEHNLF